MLCRALLFTVIITCTICQITVQAPQRLVQIKGLICVLLGDFQKEELDVNTLKKLQQYNITIGNITYNNSRQDCSSKAILYIQEETKSIEIQNPNKTTKTHNSESPINIALKTAMKYFIELQKQHNDFSPQTKSQKISVNDSSLNIIERRVKTDQPVIETRKSNKIDINITKRNIKPDKLIKAFEILENSPTSQEVIRSNSKKYSGEEPSTMNIELVTPSTLYKHEQNKILNHNNIKQFCQLLFDLFSNTTITPTTAYPIRNTKVPYLDNISRQKEFLFNMKSNFDSNITIYNKNFHPFETNDSYGNVIQIRPKEIIAKDISPNENKMLKNKIIKNINRLLWLHNSFNTSHSQNTENYNNIQPTSIPDFLKYIGARDVNQITNIINKSKIVDDNEFKHLIINDVIKDIAEQVKALVLKDLQKEIVKISMRIPTSTTTEKVTSKILEEENRDTAKVIRNLFELYQHLQSQNKGAPRPISYNPHLNVVTPIPVLPMNKSSVNSITRFKVFNSRNSQYPPAITIQTNSIEIPPLGIPISTSLNPINQNIILNTKNPIAPFKRMRNGHIIPNYIYGFKEDSDNKERAKYFNFGKHLWPHKRNDYTNYKAPYIDDFRIKSYGKSNDALNINRHGGADDLRSNNMNNGGQQHDQQNYHYEEEPYKPYKMDHTERECFQNENIKSFHERLERTNDWNTDSTEYMNYKDLSKIPQRQQHPIKHVEYPKYDDIHIQNVLKTQAKVNDMLERILATRTIPDGPPSVEGN